MSKDPMDITPDPTPDAIEPNGTPLPIRRYDALRMFSDAVLDAMDEVADEVFNSGQPFFIGGWEDSDLEYLIPMLEAHFNRLWARHHPLEAQSDEA